MLYGFLACLARKPCVIQPYFTLAVSASLLHAPWQSSLAVLSLLKLLGVSENRVHDWGPSYQGILLFGGLFVSMFGKPHLAGGYRVLDVLDVPVASLSGMSLLTFQSTTLEFGSIT